MERVIGCGHARLIDKIARDGADTVQLEIHRTLPPVLKQLKADGYELVGLEQTTGSENLAEFAFNRRTALVIGNERAGLTEEELAAIRPRRGNPGLRAPLCLQRSHGRCDGGV